MGRNLSTKVQSIPSHPMPDADKFQQADTLVQIPSTGLRYRSTNHCRNWSRNQVSKNDQVTNSFSLVLKWQ